jgi:chaperone required for assembly of F1-ATPase
MNRFYQHAEVAAVDGGFAVTLDDRPIRTPKRAALLLPNAPLAAAIAAEWAAQGEEVLPATMKLTGIANAAIDLVAPDPAAFAAPLAAYAASDLLCYRGTDRDLAARQVAEWNPVLGWAESRFGVEFAITAGVMHVVQPDATIAALSAVLLRHTPFQLAALAPLITIGGSLVVALALSDGASDGAFDADRLWQVVTLDERWQEERWGADADAVAARALKQADWCAAARFLGLVEG